MRYSNNILKENLAHANNTHSNFTVGNDLTGIYEDIQSINECDGIVKRLVTTVN